MAELNTEFVDLKSSILNSTKKLLGIQPEHDQFDDELIIDINSVFMVIQQLGLGPLGGFSIQNASDTWVSFLGNRKDLEAVKSYMYLKVRLMFDPPSTGPLVESIERQCRELECRLLIQEELFHKEGG